MSNPLRMPGSTLITWLKVYDTISPDGQRGGTPHMHFLCTEMYFVLAGSGFVELIDTNGFDRAELRPYSALIFSPGTIHRLINPAGDLELLVMMQNSGLPERGDNVVCFTEDWLGDEARYAEAMRVRTVEDAYLRRDRGVEGFLRLKSAFTRSQADGRAALNAFYRHAADRTRDLQTSWRTTVETGAAAEVAQSFRQLKALEARNLDYLAGAAHHLIHAGPYATPGFCGHLNRYFDPATLDPASLTPEGIVRP